MLPGCVIQRGGLSEQEGAVVLENMHEKLGYRLDARQMRLLSSYRQPHVALHGRVGEQPLQAGNACRDESRKHYDAETADRGVALRENAVAVKHHVRVLNHIIEPAHGVDCQQFLDVADEIVAGEVCKRVRYTAPAQVRGRAVKMHGHRRRTLAGQPWRARVEETQEYVGLLARQVHRLRNADEFQPQASVELRKRLQATSDVLARKPFHSGDAHQMACTNAAAHDGVFQGVGMHIHVLDVLEQLLGIRTHGHALARAVEQFYREERLEFADAAADGRVIEMQPLRGGVHASLSGHFEENPQVIPFHGRPAHNSLPSMITHTGRVLRPQQYDSFAANRHSVVQKTRWPRQNLCVYVYFRSTKPVSYTHLRAHETGRNLVCRLLLEKKK